MAIKEELLSEKDTKEKEKFLIPVANPETIENLMSLALIIRDPKEKDDLVALSVVNENNYSETKEIQGKRNLERTAMVAAAVDVPVKIFSRYDISISSGIGHTIKEFDITTVIIGLHRKANLMDSYFGTMTENLLKRTHRQIMISKFLIPVNTLRRIIVAVPPKAEYESGFFKWTEHFCRMGRQIGCRVHFFSNRKTLSHLDEYIIKNYPGLPTELTELEEWEELLMLTKYVNYDHVLAIITARPGSISYDPSFERLPALINKYFANNSLIVLYPEQSGDPENMISFSDPRGHNESQHYDNIGKWLNKWLRKK